MVEALIAAQADVNAQSDFGSPLERAQENDCTENIQLLLAAGAV